MATVNNTHSHFFAQSRLTGSDNQADSQDPTPLGLTMREEFPGQLNENVNNASMRGSPTNSMSNSSDSCVDFDIEF